MICGKVLHLPPPSVSSLSHTRRAEDFKLVESADITTARCRRRAFWTEVWQNLATISINGISPLKWVAMTVQADGFQGR
jgi:hypothetical protein